MSRRARQRDDDTTWMKQARCVGLTHLFFPTTTDDRLNETPAASAAAKLICEHCEVRAECREYAVRWREPCGIWGGATTRQRLGSRGARMSTLASEGF